MLRTLEQSVPGAVLEKGRFGRSGVPLASIDPRSLREAAAFLSQRSDPALDWLENLSVNQSGEALTATYFLRSTADASLTLVLRVAAGTTRSRELELPSVASSWAMAAPFEIEAGELFGIRFTDAEGKAAHPSGQRLPKGWNGYPLRKSYVFPTEYLGIPHSRKATVERS